MKYLKTFFIFLVLFLVFFKGSSSAQENEVAKNFDIEAKVAYSIQESGNTRVSQTIGITNKSEFTYIPSYSITISKSGISNISVSNSSGRLTHSEKDDGDRKTVTVNFPDKVVGIGKKNTFTFSYDSSSIATKTGNVWRVYIPSVSKNNIFSSYSVTVDVPRSFGSPTIVKPHINTTLGATSFNFSSSDLGNSGISMTFGDSQVYNFTLKYNLENKNLVPVRTEIALPPNTAYQKVDITSLSPLPEDVYADGDGNFLARYVIPGKTKLTVMAKVTVTSYANPLKTEELADVSKYLTQQKYWESKNSQVQKLAQEYNTSQKIYDYVVSTLSYSHDKVGDNNTRLGAVASLKNPSFAVCLEFTDLFIAISRAAGIPARAVEGYAYTPDKVDKPVSLFEDVLHSWPEYYDKDKKQWIMVDPTWGNTTRGVDYFNTFDFDHVAFAINGLDSEYPVPAGGYKGEKATRDIEVSFGAPAAYPPASYSITGDFPSVIFSKSPRGKVIARNTSGQEIEKVKAIIFVDNKYNIEVVFEKIPPFGKKELTVDLQNRENTFSLTNPSHVISIKNDVKTIYTKKIYVVPVSYWYLIGGGIILAATTIFVIAFKTRGLHFQKSSS